MRCSHQLPGPDRPRARYCQAFRPYETSDGAPPDNQEESQRTQSPLQAVGLCLLHDSWASGKIPNCQQATGALPCGRHKAAQYAGFKLPEDFPDTLQSVKINCILVRILSGISAGTVADHNVGKPLPPGCAGKQCPFHLAVNESSCSWRRG